MNCPKCSTPHEHVDRFCRRCGTSLSNATQHNTSNSGDHSFNAGQNNTFSGNTITFDSAHSEPQALIERVRTRPLAVAGQPVKIAWLIFSGVLGIVGSIASIWSVWRTGQQFFWMILLGFSMVTLFLGAILSRHRFARLAPFLTIESNKDGALFLTRIEGDCPKCDGILKLRDVGPKGYRKTLVRCTRNPDHKWSFDPTVLGDPEPFAGKPGAGI